MVRRDGVLVLLGLAAIAAVFEGAVVRSPVFAVLAVGAGLSVLGGLDPVPDTVAWYRSVVVGEFLFGTTVAVALLGPVLEGERTTRALLLAAAGVANALVFGFIAVDWFRGGRHYDLSRFEAGPILGGRVDADGR